MTAIETLDPDVSAEAERERPFGLMVVCALELLAALSFLGSAARLDLPGTNDKQFAALQGITGVVPFLIAVALASIAAAVGLWFARYWAWIVTVLFTAIALVVNLLAYAWDTPAPVRLLVYVLMAFYLNQGSLRHYIDAGRGSGK